MIGLYAHHQGAGHRHRVAAIRAALEQQFGEPAAVLSTWEGADVVLADDADPAADAHVTEEDRTARGTLHYVPPGRAGLRARMAQIADWIERERPRALYVDVSVEVAVLARLMGVPVVTLAMPGERTDDPHQLGYTQADRIVAAWPSWVPLPAHLEPHAARVRAVGGISRFAPLQARNPEPGTVVVLGGKGGGDWSAERWDAIAAACPEWSFAVLTDEPDPLPHLQRAEVVIAAAGQGSIADIAAAGAAAVIVPEPRPYGEQHASARVLRDAGLAVVPDAPPAPSDWPLLLQRAAALEPRWERWELDGAARRAAAAILEVALP